MDPRKGVSEELLVEKERGVMVLMEEEEVEVKTRKLPKKCEGRKGRPRKRVGGEKGTFLL